MKSKTFSATIFIAGDLEKIKETCRKFCLVGACVSVTPQDYVYTGGMESGASVVFINYPRFPDKKSEIRSKAFKLAELLMRGCCQRSCTIMFSDATEYVQNPDIVVPR